MMATSDDDGPQQPEQPALTEYVVVQCLFVTGLNVEIGHDFVRVVGWTHLPEMGGEATERRIVSRLAMPMHVAREVMADLRRKLGKGDH